MTKFVDNAFHAVKIAFANEVGRVCDKLGISATTIHKIFISDTKLNIPPYYLRPGGAIKHIRRTRNRDDVQFVIVGSGRKLEEVKKLAMAFELDGLVRFTGGVNDATLFTILSTADVCVNRDRPSSTNDKSTIHEIMESLIHKVTQPALLDSGEAWKPLNLCPLH